MKCIVVMQQLSIDKINKGNSDITAVEILEEVSHLNKVVTGKIIPYNMLGRSRKMHCNSNAFFKWMEEISADVGNKNNNEARKVTRELSKVYKNYIGGKSGLFQCITETTFYELLKVFYANEEDEAELGDTLIRIRGILEAIFAVLLVEDWQWSLLYECCLKDNSEITETIIKKCGVRKNVE